MLRRLGAVQLDTISVLARSHELVAYARLGAIPREKVERAYWHPRQPAAFEYWSHAACVLPLEEWPYYAFRRRAFARRGLRWHQSHPEVCERVLDQIRAEGPLTATELGGAKNGGPWWDWSDTKIAVEWLLDTGDVICARRTGWRRVYDLPERVLPADLAAVQLTDAECVARLAAVAARALGVVTAADLSDYQRISYRGSELRHGGAARCRPRPPPRRPAWCRSQISAGRNGPALRAWADPAAVALLGPPGSGAAKRGRHRTTLLSPFDSLVWDRKRTLRVFGFEHSLEAYVPPAKRVHGYFTMPLLAGGRLVGRVDPARSGQDPHCAQAHAWTSPPRPSRWRRRSPRRRRGSAATTSSFSRSSRRSWSRGYGPRWPSTALSPRRRTAPRPTAASSRALRQSWSR